MIEYTKCANCGTKLTDKTTMFCSDECRYFATETDDERQERVALETSEGGWGGL